MTAALPQGLISVNSTVQQRESDDAGVDLTNGEILHDFWKVHAVQSKATGELAAIRSRNLFWRVWSDRYLTTSITSGHLTELWTRCKQVQSLGPIGDDIMIPPIPTPLLEKCVHVPRGREQACSVPPANAMAAKASPDNLPHARGGSRSVPSQAIRPSNDMNHEQSLGDTAEASQQSASNTSGSVSNATSSPSRPNVKRTASSGKKWIPFQYQASSGRSKARPSLPRRKSSAKNASGQGGQPQSPQEQDGTRGNGTSPAEPSTTINRARAGLSPPGLPAASALAAAFRNPASQLSAPTTRKLDPGEVVDRIRAGGPPPGLPAPPTAAASNPVYQVPTRGNSTIGAGIGEPLDHTRARGPPPGLPVPPTAAISKPAFHLSAGESSWQSVASGSPKPPISSTAPTTSCTTGGLVDPNFRRKFVEDRQKMASSTNLTGLGGMRKTGSIVRFADDEQPDSGKGKGRAAAPSAAWQMRDSMASNAIVDDSDSETDSSSSSAAVGLPRNRSLISLQVNSRRSQTGTSDIGPPASNQASVPVASAENKDQRLLDMGRNDGVTRGGGIRVPTQQRVSGRQAPDSPASQSPEGWF